MDDVYRKITELTSQGDDWPHPGKLGFGTRLNDLHKQLATLKEEYRVSLAYQLRELGQIINPERQRARKVLATTVCCRGTLLWYYYSSPGVYS